MAKTAYCIHHTHWDLIWYFTAQDAAVQFAYNMKEMLEGFRTGQIENFFLDGQTAPLDEYLRLHPEDGAFIRELIADGRLIIGPFQSQLDCFISSGESVIQNLRLGMRTAEALGHVSRIAYLPDSFGHSYDFPKIFRSFGIENFVITRGVGDEYGLGSEFYMQSNDGSTILVCTMIAGYGYGCYAFKEGRLFEDSAQDYNRIGVRSLIDRLLSYSTLPEEFVFPLGFDQNPAILNIPQQICRYNEMQKEIVFKSATWEEFCAHVRACGQGLKTHRGELFSTQYHRVHKSIFSARADIKALQDRCERLLTYELQPMMSMLDSLGVPYEHGLLSQAWDTLLKCQTHSSATLTDETNDYIERETKNALRLAQSAKIYLMKLLALSVGPKKTAEYPLIIFNTLPVRRSQTFTLKLLTKSPYFEIRDKERRLPYTLLKSVKKNHGVLRKDVSLIEEDKFYYESDVLLTTEVFEGMGYRTWQVCDTDAPCGQTVSEYGRFIENEWLRIWQDEDGITFYDKKRGRKMKRAVYLEESGDEGDSFDYSYPSHDWILTDDFADAEVRCHTAGPSQWMTIKGSMQVPSDLTARKKQVADTALAYEITLTLYADRERAEVSGTLHNQSRQHRVRFVVRGLAPKDASYAGTQFGVVARKTRPDGLDRWREQGWFEEPSPTFPLLNHVSMQEEDKTVSVFTRSIKEYELIGEGCSDLALTLFRSYGAMGYPDLHRRPGRPSGLDYMVFETPKCQMIGDNSFALALQYFDTPDANQITNAYIDYACEPSYYQRQDFDKSLYPLSYFPTNPWRETLPGQYDFLQLADTPASFGSLVKSERSGRYLLRLYNNEITEAAGGVLKSKAVGRMVLTDLQEKRHDSVLGALPAMKGGELRILALECPK